MGLGWANSYGTGKGDDAITSGLEGAWTPSPIRWDNSYFETLFGYEWRAGEESRGRVAVDPDGCGCGRTPCRMPQDPAKRHAPVMLTTDLSLRMDPIYEPISRRFYENPQELADAFARAWFKLTHRDMGPITRYLGPLVPAEPQIWQDPVPPVTHELIGADDIAALKRTILASGLTVSQLVSAAWAVGVVVPRQRQARWSQRGRIRLAPQNDWEVNNPAELAEVLRTLEGIQRGVQRRAGGREEASLARRPDRARRMRGRGAGGEERRARR